MLGDLLVELVGAAADAALPVKPKSRVGRVLAWTVAIGLFAALAYIGWSQLQAGQLG